MATIAVSLKVKDLILLGLVMRIPLAVTMPENQPPVWAKMLAMLKLRPKR